MKRSRVLGLLVGMIAFVLNSSQGFAETLSAGKVLPPAAVQSYRILSNSKPMPAMSGVGIASKAVSSEDERWVFIPARSSEGIDSVTVVESSGRSLDQLRRQAHRYPDQDLANRFAEAATECPPLFE